MNRYLLDTYHLSQFDLLIAALARQRGLILPTADQDFRPVTGLQVENWL